MTVHSTRNANSLPFSPGIPPDLAGLEGLATAREVQATRRPAGPGAGLEAQLASPLCLEVVFRRVLATKCYVCYVSVMRTISQRELRNQSASVLRDVQAGEVIIVTRNGTPVAELRPVAPRRFVPRATIAGAALGAPRIDSLRFRADVDAHVGQYVDGQ